jgi:diguanylate cyclase
MDAPESLIGPKGLQAAHAAVDLMGSYAVAPTPENYEVWLNYHLGHRPELRQAIDSLVHAGTPMNESISRALYDQFFAGDVVSAQVMIAGEQIARELSGVMAILESAGDKTGSYGAVLSSTASRLEQGVDPGSLRELVSGLAKATQDMAEHNKRLNAQLAESSAEITGLRENLAQARAESLSDGLTGLANRRYFDEVLRMRVDEAKGSGNTLTLIMCDIDFFKRFNDTWGHQTGDQIIRFAAGSLKSDALPDHLVARYGGEEFAVILPRKNLSAGQLFAENVRRRVEGKKLLRKSTNEDLGRVTISLGVAQWAEGETPQSLIERADAALYASKRNGRNRTTLADPPEAQRSVA